MNRIEIKDNKILNCDIEYEYKEKEEQYGINELTFIINKNSKLLFLINNNNKRLIINFNILNNIDLKLVVITKGTDSKIQYNYNLESNSNLEIEKLNIVDGIREMINVNLESNSNLDYIFKSTASNKEFYDYMIYHNGNNSNSNIINNSINYSGSIYYQISSFIPKNIVGCNANQYNRIINNTSNKCEIRPNLYIDCDDVTANHSALIDKFNDREIFYLMSKGIKECDCIKLLERGFLLNKITNKEIIDIINKRFGGE